MNRTLTRCRALVALLGALAFALPAQAQPGYRDDPRDSWGIPQTVVRVAYFSGPVSYSRGDDPDDWRPASRNFPMAIGDRVYTAGRSRLELQTEEGEIYLAPRTELAALDLMYDVKQFSLGTGTASFRLRRLEDDETFEVDTPSAAVTFGGPGYFRIDVERDGDTRVTVFRGTGWVAAGGGEVPIEAGRQIVLEGGRSPVYDVASLPRRDAWDRWVESRGRRGLGGYVHAGIAGVDDLDAYGRWSNVPGYGRCWSPAGVSADWRPYWAGRWVWQDPWGWTWVSSEPWGWAPYHYGRWVVYRSSWYWVPVSPEVTTASYAPALVAFVGGPGFSLSVSVGGSGSGGYVGWFPLAPSDPLVPWWGSGARTTSLAAATYANRSRVTMVAERAFVSGEPVPSAVVRDARVAREISTAPVVRGPLPIVPTESSIRVSRGTASAPRPPAELLSRAVVTRRAPPPAPPRFREKERLIRENRGAPLVPAEASRLATEGRTIRPTRPVLAREGRVELAPKDARGADPVPVPVTREAPPRRSRNENPARAGRERPSAPPDAAPRRELSRAPAEPERRDAEARSRAADARNRQRAEEARVPPRAAEAKRPARPEARARETVEKQKAAEKAKPAKGGKKAKPKPPKSEER